MNLNNSKRVEKNIVYNIILQLISLVLPFVVIPHVSRALTPDGTGIYSFTASIVGYFTLIAGLGLSIYGTRQIAFSRDEKESLNKTFSSLFYLKLISSILSLLIYYAMIPLFEERYSIGLLIQGIMLVSMAVDISWLYFGLEDFKGTLIPTLVVKTLTVSSVLIFVRDTDDVWIYVLISALGSLLGNCILWAGLNGRTKLVKVHVTEIFAHIRPISTLFISFIAVEAYTVLDKTMIGFLSNDSQVALYTYSEQFAKAALGVIGAISTALLPYMSALKSKKNENEFKKSFNASLTSVAMMGIAASFGVAGIAKEFIPWMLGQDYQSAVKLLIVLAPLPAIVSISSTITRVYMLPSKRDKLCNIVVVSAAVLNVTLNSFLIPRYQALGACVATVFAECYVAVSYLIVARKDIDIKLYLKSIGRYVLFGTLMIITVRVIGICLGSAVWVTVLQVLVGCIVYICCLMIAKEELIIRVFMRFRKRTVR